MHSLEPKDLQKRLVLLVCKNFENFIFSKLVIIRLEAVIRDWKNTFQTNKIVFYLSKLDSHYETSSYIGLGLLNRKVYDPGCKVTI